MKSNLAIIAKNISKQYRLGEVGTGTISHDLNRFWAKMRGKEDPFLKIGDSNDRTAIGDSDYVWSLKDINFEIEKGDAVGIIGRNGAGKSTLLKLLSRVTKPTTGHFEIQGRIASLLEVGTGFNPEMTGRENIFLNGAILGMRKQEIKKKFDEIVDFAGVERYIDTPVKRYSSGMYVRLAFAVAAHLESEILIVDEVLAVGDAEFQKKCLGKMGDVSKGEGRTVLFVSHNMVAVKKLCNNAIILHNGKSVFQGNLDNSIQFYEKQLANANTNMELDFPIDDKLSMQIYSVKLIGNSTSREVFYNDEEIKLLIKGTSRKNIRNAYITVDVRNLSDELVYWTSDYSSERFQLNIEGDFVLKVILPKFILTAGIYNFTFAISSPTYGIVHYQPEFVIQFELFENENSFLQSFGINRPGKTAIESVWKYSK